MEKSLWIQDNSQFVSFLTWNFPLLYRNIAGMFHIIKQEYTLA